MNIVERIDNEVEIRRILISVFNKDGLKAFVENFLGLSPDVEFYSTGGTFRHLYEVLGEERASTQLRSISDYTGQPEMQGGLVKTLDFKIYLGLLSETYNQAHRKDLGRVSAEDFDMVVVNLYPFPQVISEPGTTPEMARANIDIGGPCMIRAAAKNFIRVAPVVDPADYEAVIENLREGGGALPLHFRFQLACKAFAKTAEYDSAICEYLGKVDFQSVQDSYRLE